MEHSFEYAGLYNGLFVMADVTTGSVWTHYDGTVLQGELAGEGLSMEIQPLVHTTWKRWLEQHPETLVLDRIDAYEDLYGSMIWNDNNIGNSWFGPQFQATLADDVDDRLPADEVVVGVGVGDDYRAYGLERAPGLTVVNDVLGTHRILVVLDPANSFGMAYSAMVDGELRSFGISEGELADETGATWSLEGVAPDGERLAFVTSFVTEWYGWAAHHPETTVHIVSG